MAQTSILVAEDPAVDLAVVEAMVNHLEDYIIRTDLYQTVFASTPRGDQSLQMTGGDLLTRLYRLQYQRDSLTSDQVSHLDLLQTKADETIKSLKTRFYDRLQVEVKARLNSISWFLDDVAGDAQRRRVEYPFEIRNRQRIEEILKLIGDRLDEQLLNHLRSIDKRIRAVTTAGSFVWDKKLEGAFPNTPYWYLHVSP